MCQALEGSKCVSELKSEMYGPQKRACGSARFPQRQSPWDTNMMQVALVWPVAQRTGALARTLELRLPVCSRPSLCRTRGWAGAGPTGRRRSSPALSMVPLCLQSFFSAGVVYISSELKEPLCSRRYGKHRPVWEGPRHWAWPTCLSG